MASDPQPRPSPVFSGLDPVCTVAEIRAIEARALAGAAPLPLMERAGAAAAALARDLLGPGQRVLVLAGPGNNGGDGFVAARHLRQAWLETEVVFAAEPARLPADAAEAYALWSAAGGTSSSAFPSGKRWDLIIDGLFGIGLERELTGLYADWIAQASASGTRVLALDIPSGLHGDSGRVLGTALRADHTITFIARKPGLLTGDGSDYCGHLHVADLGLAADAASAASGQLLSEVCVIRALPRRARNSHKGSFGTVAIVGGATGMAGAALLAGRAALCLGAGRVYVGFAGDDAPPVDVLMPELMLRKAEEAATLVQATCIVAGPGLGQSDGAVRALDVAVDRPVALVLDADALNLIAADTARAARIRDRSAATILTPHPAEAARLLGITTAEVQRDRVGAVRRLAAGLRAFVVLKGAGSLCAWPDRRWQVNPTGNPGMASAGMGDVLAGMIGALVAQGASAPEALAAGVYLHGAAGDAVALRYGGTLGVTASEVLRAAPRVANSIVCRDRPPVGEFRATGE